MNKQFFNLEKIVRIIVYDFQPSRWYGYKKAKKFVGITFRKEGLYGWHNFIAIADIKKELPNCVLKDGAVLEKPECRLFFDDGHATSYFFETYEQAISKAEEIKIQCGKWITIEENK